jgi:hypothetical protein
MMDTHESLPLAVGLPARAPAQRGDEVRDERLDVDKQLAAAREQIELRAREEQMSAAEALLLRKQLDLYEEHHRHGGSVNAWDGRTLVATVLVTGAAVAIVDAGRHTFLTVPTAALPAGAEIGSLVQGSAQSGLWHAEGPGREIELGRERGL